MQFTAIAILLIFYGCYFIKMLAQKRKGIQTDQIGRGKKGFVKAIEVTMKMITLIVPLAELVSIILNTSPLPMAIRWCGAAIALMGDAAFVLSVLTMGDSWRAGVPERDETALITGGIYSISRNPAFLGFDLVYVGILLMFFNPVLLIISAFAMLMFHLQIVNVEEDFLLAAFGDEYLTYRKRVNRYLGRKIRA